MLGLREPRASFHLSWWPCRTWGCLFRGNSTGNITERRITTFTAL
ncbi:unnamed protein product [Brassica rapa subsp. trilocularis]